MSPNLNIAWNGYRFDRIVGFASSSDGPRGSSGVSKKREGKTSRWAKSNGERYELLLGKAVAPAGGAEQSK